MCREASETYLLTTAQADDIIDAQVTTIDGEWDEAADVARLTIQDMTFLWKRQILNPYIDS